MDKIGDSDKANQSNYIPGKRVGPVKIGLSYKNLFDGGQDQLVVSTWNIDCLCCGKRINFGIADCKSFVQLEINLKEIVLSGIKSVELNMIGDTIFYRVDRLPLHYFKLACQSCGKTNLGILGLGECQAARYMVVLVGLMVLD